MKPIQFQPAHRNRFLMLTASIAVFSVLFVVIWNRPSETGFVSLVKALGMTFVWGALAAKWRPKSSEVQDQPELVQFAVTAANQLRVGLTQIKFDDGAAPDKENSTLKIPQAYLTHPDQAFVRASIAHTLATNRLTIWTVSIFPYLFAITSAMAYTPPERKDVVATIALAIPVAVVLYLILTWRRRHAEEIRQAIEISGDEGAMRRYIESRGWSNRSLLTLR